ncbi:WxL domain-containing protein [Enterococcus faecalis]|nr:WxL domain-containing protein [Enterococcus faecalis]EHH1657395.1 WxL domain-containing protein [Enterococcus faecalis]EHZ5576906.1 WxL domain-containing protein [Enterococcus faecalis]
MNQKVKKIFATALCCSLLISSLNGISAVAETLAAPDVQVEDHQTAVPSEWAQGQELASFPKADLEAGVPPADEELPEQTEQVVGQVEAPVTSPITGNTPESLRGQRAVQTIDIPEKTYQMSFLDESGRFIDPAKVSITGDIMKYTLQGTLTKVGSVATDNVETTKQMTVPKVALSGDTTTKSYEFSGIQNEKITLPRFYNVPKITPSANYTGQVYPVAVTKQVNLTGEVTNEETTGARLNMFGSDTPNQFVFSRTNWNNDPAGNMFARGFNMATAGGTPAYLTTDDHIYYYVPNKRVNVYYNDMTPNGLPAYPPGYNATLSKTVIDSENFHYKAPKSFPEFFSSGNRHFQFKGWYKGASRPADPKAVKLETSLTPEFDVTYDGADNLYIFYDEVPEMTTTFPEVKYNFGFVDEKGTLISPTNVEIQTNLTTVVNETAQNVGTATGVDVGNLKQLTVPSQTLTYVPKIKRASSGTTNFHLTLPKRYKTPTVTPGSFYTGSTTAYPVATTMLRYVNGHADDRIITDGSSYRLYNSTTPHSYRMFEIYWEKDITKTLFSAALSMATTEAQPGYFTTDDTMYYFLENRRVTENFVDGTGAKITAPTGFKQGKQTVIDSDDFTYTQEGTLPYIYKINNKPYVLKGWYKGKEKPAKLNQITKEKPNISYPVSYDDQDDVTVVYDELKLAGNTIQFGFVNEQGNYIPPTSKFNVSTDIGEVTNATYTKLQTVNSTVNGNYLSLTIPAYNPTGGIGQGTEYYGSRNSIVTIPKYYKPPTLTPPSNYAGAAYPTATGVVDYHDDATYAYLPSRLNLTPVSGSQTNYRLPQAIWTDEETKTAFSSLYKMNATSTSDTTMGLAEIYATGTVNYYLENRRVTENFVDDTGAKITPPADFTQGKQTVIDSDDFTYTSAKALPASYTADGKSYVLQGWYKGTEKPTTLETSKTPSYSVTYNDQDDLTVVYKEGTISADLTMRGAVDVIDNGAPMEYWEVLLKNTGEVPLTSIKIKPTTDWMSGISTPTELFILGTGQNAKARPITKEQWEAGFEIPLDSSLPVGGQLTINLIGTKVTGQPGQVLEAAVEVTGNFGNLKASDTVRIKDLDQEIKEPTGEGFISVPTFDFGQVGVASATKQHGLKKAADYYGNGTRNPYVRISKTQPNWSLTAQLSQPKSATDSLPTATRLLLGAAPVSSFSNYNQPTELKNAIGTTNAIHLTANNAATSIIANQQFTGSDVYQLDFTFANIKLEVPANQGTAGQQYQAAVTWNLVTGP